MDLYTLPIGIDKIKHLLVSLLIFLVIFYVRKYKIKNRGNFRIVSYTIRDVLVIGLLKEFVDLFGFGNPEVKDLLADSIGIIFPIYIYYLFKESKKMENTNLFKYEVALINKLEQNIVSIFKDLYILVKIKYERIFFKRIILSTLKSRIKKYYFLKSVKNLSKISKMFFVYTIIWILNLFVLLLKIPLLAFADTFEIFFKSISYSFYRLKKIMN